MSSLGWKLRFRALFLGGPIAEIRAVDMYLLSDLGILLCAQVEAMAAAMEEEKLEEVATLASSASPTTSAAAAAESKEAQMARRWRRYRKLKKLFKRSAKRARARTLEEQEDFPFGLDGLGSGDASMLTTTGSSALSAAATPRSSFRRSVRRSASTALSPSVHPLLSSAVPSLLPSPSGTHSSKSGTATGGSAFSFDTPRASRKNLPVGSSPSLTAVDLAPEILEPPPLLAATLPSRRTWGMSKSLNKSSKANESPGCTAIGGGALTTEADPRIEQAELRAMALARERDVFLVLANSCQRD